MSPDHWADIVHLEIKTKNGDLGDLTQLKSWWKKHTTRFYSPFSLFYPDNRDRGSVTKGNC